MRHDGLAMLAALWILAGTVAAASLLLTSGRIEWSAAYHAKKRSEVSVLASRLDGDIRRVLAGAVQGMPQDAWPPEPDPLRTFVTAGSVSSVRWTNDGVRLLIVVSREDVHVRWPRYYLRP